VPKGHGGSPYEAGAGDVTRGAPGSPGPLVDSTAVTVGAGVVPVAVKVTGEPVRPELVAVRVLGPALGPRVQLVTVADTAPSVDVHSTGDRNSAGSNREGDAHPETG